MASPQNLKNLKTPSLCTADFSLTPVSHVPALHFIQSSGELGHCPDGSIQIGTASPSYSQQIADVQGLVRESGLKHQLHATGTTVGRQRDSLFMKLKWVSSG
jgi:hypothetical protein